MSHVKSGFAFCAVTLLASLSGCGGSSSSQPPTVNPPVAGLLRAAASAEEFETALRAGFTTVANANGNEALAAGDAASAAPGNFTGTYTQEVAVDEFDAVRYDGDYLYIAPRRYANCCFIAATDSTFPADTPAVDSLRILATDPDQATAAPVASIELEDNVSVQGLYVEGDKLFALTAESFYGVYGPAWTDLAIWAPETVGYRIYDTTDKQQPVLDTAVTIDGLFVDSRRIGNTVYIITRYTPNLPGLLPVPQSNTDTAQNESALSGASLDELLPKITIDGNSQPLVEATQCYLNNDGRDIGHPVITNVTAVPIDNPAAFENTCYNAGAYGAYVSAGAIYFTELLDGAASQTRIHKFALTGTSVRYRGSGDVPGQVWRGGQADFRMSEQDGNLRVFSSEFTANSTDFVEHRLIVLREAASEPALEIVGQLPNASRPQPIGKPNEQLYGVRFLGDRAYAVTFEQIDPLYVFDLADPTDPSITGELEVPGFSDFLHPVTDELLLGLGTDAAGGVKLELFDVSNMAMPLSRGQVVLGDQFAWSEALWNRHAFTWQPDVNGVDRFTIPATLRESDGNQAIYRTSLHLFEIRDKTLPNLASLAQIGSLSPPPNASSPWADRSRAFINNDTVYYVRDELVWSAFWGTPDQVNGPF